MLSYGKSEKGNIFMIQTVRKPSAEHDGVGSGPKRSQKSP